MINNKLKSATLGLLTTIMPMVAAKAQEIEQPKQKSTWHLNDMRLMIVGVGWSGRDNDGYSRLFTDIEFQFTFGDLERSRWMKQCGIEGGLGHTRGTDSQESIKDTYAGAAASYNYCVTRDPNKGSIGAIIKGGFVMADYAVDPRQTGAYLKLGLTSNFELYKTQGCGVGLSFECYAAKNTIRGKIVPCALVGLVIKTK